MPSRDFQADAAAEAVPEEVGLLDAELPEQRHDVIGEGRWRHLSVDVSGVSVALHLDGDDPVGLSQGRDHRSEALADRKRTSVQEHERRAAAVDLVVHLEPVNGGVRRRRHDPQDKRHRRLLGPLGPGIGRPPFAAILAAFRAAG